MRKIYFAQDRTWVGECSQDATHEAAVPDLDDPRWQPGVPLVLDTPVLTLSPFYPSGRLGAEVEIKASKPFSQYPNHPPFAGVKFWMHLDAVQEAAVEVETNYHLGPRP